MQLVFNVVHAGAPKRYDPIHIDIEGLPLEHAVSVSRDGDHWLVRASVPVPTILRLQDLDVAASLAELTLMVLADSKHERPIQLVFEDEGRESVVCVTRGGPYLYPGWTNQMVHMYLHA